MICSFIDLGTIQMTLGHFHPLTKKLSIFGVTKPLKEIRNQVRMRAKRIVRPRTKKLSALKKRMG